MRDRIGAWDRLEPRHGMFAAAVVLAVAFAFVVVRIGRFSHETGQPPEPDDYQVIAQTGGSSDAMLRLDQTIYLGHGQRVLSVDVSARDGGLGTIVATSPVLPGIVRALAARDDWLYAAVEATGREESSSGIAVLRLDIAGRLPMAHWAPSEQRIVDLAVDGGWLMAAGTKTGFAGLVGRYHEGIEAWDLSEPGQPAPTGWHDQHEDGLVASDEGFVDVEAHDGHSYMLLNQRADSIAQLRVLASHAPAGDGPVQTLNLQGKARGLSLGDKRLALLADADWLDPGLVELHLFDLSDPAQVRRTGGRLLADHRCDGVWRMSVESRGEEMILAESCGRRLMKVSGLETASPRVEEIGASETGLGALLLAPEGSYMALGLHGGMRFESSASDSASWILDLLGAVDRLATDGQQVWTAHPHNPVERRSIESLREARVAEVAYQRSEAAPVDLVLHEEALILADGEQVLRLNPDTLEAMESTPIGGPVVQLESESGSLFIGAGTGGWSRLVIEDGQFRTMARNDAMLAGPFDISGDRLVGFVREPDAFDSRVVELDPTSLAPRTLGPEVEALLSRDPPGSSAILVTEGGAVAVSGCGPRDPGCSGVGPSTLHVFDLDVEHGLVASDTIPLAAILGSNATTIRHGSPDRIIVGGDRGLVDFDRPPTDTFAARARWESGSGIRDLEILRSGDTMPDELLVALGAGGVAHLARAGLHPSTPTPTALPTSAPRPEYRAHLPIVYQSEPSAKATPPPDPPAGRWQEAYIGAFTGSIASDGQRIYRDEGGQLVVLEIGQDGQVYEIGRGPSLGSLYRDLVIARPQTGLDIAIASLLGGPLVLLDVSDPTHIHEITRWRDVRADSIVLSGQRLFWSEDEQLHVGALRGPDYPAPVDSVIPLNVDIGSLYAYEGRIYATEYIGGGDLHVIDPDADSGQRLRSSHPMDYDPMQLHFVDDRLIIEQGIQFPIYDISDPDRPILIEVVQTEHAASGGPRVAIVDHFLYSLSNMGSSEPGLRVYDLKRHDADQNPAMLEEVARIDLEGLTSGTLMEPLIVGDAVVAMYSGLDLLDPGHDDLIVYDLSSPESPELRAWFRPMRTQDSRLSVGAGGELIVSGALREDWTWHPLLRRIPIDLPARRTNTQLELDPAERPIGVLGRRLVTVVPRSQEGRQAVRIYEIPEWPELELLGSFEADAWVADVTIDGDRVFASLAEDTNSGIGHAILAAEIDTEDRVIMLGELPIRARWPVHVEDGRLYAIEEDGALGIYDVRDPAAVDRIGGVGGCGVDFGLRDGQLFCLDEAGIRVLDLQDPRSPVERSVLALPAMQGLDFHGSTVEMALGERLLYVVSRTVLAIDVTDLDRPSFVGERRPPAVVSSTSPDFVMGSAVTIGDRLAAIMRGTWARGIATFSVELAEP